MRAYLSSAQHRFNDAISTLESLRDEAERVQNHYFALRVAAHLSVVRFSANETTAALSELRRVLNVAAQAGIRQTILDEGPKVGALLIDFQETAERTVRRCRFQDHLAGLELQRHLVATGLGHAVTA